jgi:hypothetical protein
VNGGSGGSVSDPGKGHTTSLMWAAPLILYARWHMSIADNLAVNEKDHNFLGDKQVRNVDQAYRLAI